MYTNKLLEEFVTFQDSQGKRKAYLMEKNWTAYSGKNENGKEGLALGGQAQSIVDLIGMIFIPMYRAVELFLFSWASYWWCGEDTGWPSPLASGSSS
jgi:hypothetical protein